MSEVDFIFDLKKYGIKSGFDRIYRLLDFLGNPHEDLKSVQIGGTNGKGSTARMVESCLLSEGYDVGVYTSPHMIDLGERVRINDEKMRHKRIKDFVSKVRPIIEKMVEEGDPPTFFETTTAMAFHEFKRRKVDIAVLEVGVGGRLDSTSVCSNSVSAITSIGIDHKQILGETTENIAKEIGEIIPQKGVCISGSVDELKTLKEIAEKKKSSLLSVGNHIDYKRLQSSSLNQKIKIEGEYLDQNITFSLPLLGKHQANNAAVAVGVLEALDLDIQLESIIKGMRKANLPCRFELVQREPKVILDAAHNLQASKILVENLKEEIDWDSLHLIFGVLSDKEIGKMIGKLDEISDYVYTVPPSTPRAENPDILSNIFEEARSFKSVSGGVNKALELAFENDIVVATGSLYVASEARRNWKPLIFRKNKKVNFKNLTLEESRRIERKIDRKGGDTIKSGKGREEGHYVDLSVKVLEIEEFLKNLGLYNHVPKKVQNDKTDVMGILNITPDSFYDGGRYYSVDKAVERAKEISEEGADIIDVGAESTRPGADPVSVNEEKSRILPVLEKLSDLDIKLSVDTRKPEIAEAALDNGFDIINDQSGLEHPGMRDLVAERDCKAIVMDSVNLPVDPKSNPEYDDVIEDVSERLLENVLRAKKWGIEKEKLILDPGIGFGKGKKGDSEILGRVEELSYLGYPLLIGCSRKSFLGGLTDLPKEDRLEPSLAANVIASLSGANIVRVHDVEETVKAVKTTDALCK